MQPLPPHIAALPRPQGELEVIRHRSRLIVGRSRIVRTSVADTAVIEVVPYGEHEIDVIGVALGATTLTIWFENEPEPLIYVVRVVRDPGLEDRRRDHYDRLEGELRALFPSSRVTLIPLSYSVVVKGHAPSAAEAAKILEVVRREVVGRDCPPPGLRQEGIGQVPHGCRTGVEPGVGHCDVVSSVVSMLEVPGAPQVAIRVTAAELNRERLRRMGIDLGAVLQNGRPDVAPFAYGPPGNCGAILENGEAHALLNWLATSGAGQVLAEPSVVVVSGHAAEFHTGGEFAVPTVDGLAAASFRSYGTSLSVLPTVLDGGIIRLQIRSARTEPDERTSVGGVPGLLSRRAATTVDLREGQTVALAGLIGRRPRAGVCRVPLLGGLSLVGPSLFTTKHAAEYETELLVLVTAELVRPGEAVCLTSDPASGNLPLHDRSYEFDGSTHDVPVVGDRGPFEHGRIRGDGVRPSGTLPPLPPPALPSPPSQRSDVAPLPVLPPPVFESSQGR